MHALPEQFVPLTNTPVLLPVLFDYAATFIWALSGAVIAARRGLIPIGVITVAIVSATGGGLLRDGLLLPNQTPALLTNPIYVLLAMGAALLVLTFGRDVDRSKYLPVAVRVADALGSGTYAVVGVDRAIAAHLPLVGIIIVGMVNAVGGAMMRDLLIGRAPRLFRPGRPVAFAALTASLLFSLLTLQFGMSHKEAAFITISTVFALDMILLRFNIRSHPVESFRGYWDDAA
jgi:uncharacterized membrane protein YeiH